MDIEEMLDKVLGRKKEEEKEEGKKEEVTEQEETPEEPKEEPVVQGTIEVREKVEIDQEKVSETVSELMEIMGGEEKKEETKEEKKSKPIHTVRFKDFVIEEETSVPAKTVWLIYGEKGTGKTTTALSFPGEIVVLSFDRKSQIIKATRYNNDPRIHVFDVTKYMVYKDQRTITESAAKTYDYILAILDYVEQKIKPDWIVIDGSEIMSQICEWTMRYNNEIDAFAGIANLNLWKERRMLIRAIHNRSLTIAKRGVIYTTYTTYEEIVINGELITRKDVPRWIDVLVYETDFVLKTDYDPVTKRFKVIVVTSKDDNTVKTGSTIDVTDKKFWDEVKGVLRNE